MQMAEALHVHEDVLGTYPAEADRYGADVRSRLEQAGSVDVRRYLEAGRAADELGPPCCGSSPWPPCW